MTATCSLGVLPVLRTGMARVVDIGDGVAVVGAAVARRPDRSGWRSRPALTGSGDRLVDDDVAAIGPLEVGLDSGSVDAGDGGADDVGQVGAQSGDAAAVAVDEVLQHTTASRPG